MTTPQPLPGHLPFPMGLAELFDAHGWPRMVGRVIGELLLAEEAYLSTADLCARIPTSKGHLSTTMRMLSSMGMVERFGVPGSRRDHYRLTHDAFLRTAEKAAEPSRRLAAAADRALADVEAGSRASVELTRMRDFYAFLARRFPDLVAEFEAGAR
jgi:DNA-binding transcriptional regulator GbsR (MarR family)